MDFRFWKKKTPQGLYAPEPKMLSKGMKFAGRTELTRLLKNEDEIRNSFGQCFGGGPQQYNFGAYGAPFGPPGTPNGMGAYEQVSDTTTLFTNLRWYLVSNFRQLLSELYVEIGLIQTIVDVPVDDGLRGGITIKSKQLEEEEIKELQISIDRDGDLLTMGKGAKWTRLFGGGGIVIIVDDQDPESPLDLASIGPDTDIQFRAVDMWELYWDKQNTEGYDPEIQTEEFEFYDYYASKIHKSRVMRLKGPDAPSFIRPRLRGWGFSVVESLVRSINQYLKATDLTFEVLDEFKVDVYKMKNLINTLLMPNGANQVKERIGMANYQKNFQNAIVMDSEDDWDHKQLSFTGLAEAQAGIRKQVCSDLRMPATKLFGSSEATGLGNADQNDMENYNSMVESQVRNILKYDILRMIEIKCQKLFGRIPDDLEIEFKPLRVLSALDDETVKEKKFNRVFQAHTTGLITTQEFRDACNKGGLFDVKLDTNADALNPEDPQIGEVIEEGKHSAFDVTDTLDPGANREDSRSPKATVELSSATGEKTKAKKEPPSNLRGPKKNTSDKLATEMGDPGAERGKTSKEPEAKLNSPDFDRASFEASTEDHMPPGREVLFMNPGDVDEALWSKAKEASMKSYGRHNWQFVTFMYKKMGGKFNHE